MYNVELFRKPPFRKSLGCMYCKTGKCTADWHESEFYWESASGFFLYQGWGIAREQKYFNPLAAVLVYKQMTTVVTYRSVYNTVLYRLL
jgi:hypothetical protein